MHTKKRKSPSIELCEAPAKISDLLDLFFIKCSNSLFTIEIADNACPWYSIFCLITKTFSDRFEKYFFCQNVGVVILHFFGKKNDQIIIRK